MERLQSIDAFRALQGRLLASRGADHATLVIPAGTCGQASGANDLIRIAKREILYKGLTERLHLRITGCHGYCQMEPSVLVLPSETFYPRVAPAKMPLIVDAAARGAVVPHLLFTDPDSGRPLEKQSEVPFFRDQVRTILSRNERIDPIRIFNYIEDGGYSALAGVLRAHDPGGIVREIEASGLRGRGGAGFPTGRKWRLLAAAPDGRGKILVCNADEGDPGAYMDRSVLEGNPHSVLEGMLIGAFATGAAEGVIYVRNEYPLAIKHLIIALRQAREVGLLGEAILGTTFRFDITLVRGAGAFVCGEETALMRSVEGRTGEPIQRPPFPVQKGIERKPTVINNVETWANVPDIILRGADAFARTGAPGNSGTKIFSLVGRVRNTGLVEVPMGTTVSRIVNAIGGGPAGRARIKAVQTGGPSGGCIPVHRFDLPIDYDSLSQAGSIMGSGGMIVLDENTCMVDLAKYYMAFLKDESCGKCFTCRKGTQRMYELLDDISAGRGTRESVDLLEELAGVVKDTSLCGLGQTAPNPALSTLRYFRDEYLEHVENGRCRAGVCRDLAGAPCQSSCPLGTEAWRYVAHIARNELEEAYRVIREANPFPSVCARVCNHPCEDKCRAGVGTSQPVAIRALKRFVTDRVAPAAVTPHRLPVRADIAPVAIVGAGPAGLTAAHYLSLKGLRSTVFEQEDGPGGMLFSAIPPYRLPRSLIENEIAALLDDNVTLKCGVTLGRDVTVDGLFEAGFKAVFLALGAHRSLELGIEGEHAEGVVPAIRFLKAFNLKGESMAWGRVGVIGGGNAAVDAARVALRQPGVQKVTIVYRRSRRDMPAYSEEVEAALQEGVRIRTLLTPVRILERQGRLTGLECLANRLEGVDERGRQKPVPVAGSEETIDLDTLIVAVSEGSDTDCVAVAGESRVVVTTGGAIVVDPLTLETSRPGVFAGGDVATGPNTVVDAIAAGKRAASVIERYLTGVPLQVRETPPLPRVFVEPALDASVSPIALERTELRRSPLEWRRRGFEEVEMGFTAEQAVSEACRCLRCDLEFTRPREEARVSGEGDRS